MMDSFVQSIYLHHPITGMKYYLPPALQIVQCCMSIHRFPSMYAILIYPNMVVYPARYFVTPSARPTVSFSPPQCCNDRLGYITVWRIVWSWHLQVCHPWHYVIEYITSISLWNTSVLEFACVLCLCLVQMPERVIRKVGFITGELLGRPHFILSGYSFNNTLQDEIQQLRKVPTNLGPLVVDKDDTEQSCWGRVRRDPTPISVRTRVPRNVYVSCIFRRHRFPPLHLLFLHEWWKEDPQCFAVINTAISGSRRILMMSSYLLLGSVFKWVSAGFTFSR